MLAPAPSNCCETVSLFTDSEQYSHREHTASDGYSGGLSGDPDAEAQAETVFALCAEFECDIGEHVRTSDVACIINELSIMAGEQPPANDDLEAVLSRLDPQCAGYVSNMALAAFWINPPVTQGLAPMAEEVAQPVHPRPMAEEADEVVHTIQISPAAAEVNEMVTETMPVYTRPVTHAVDEVVQPRRLRVHAGLAPGPTTGIGKTPEASCPPPRSRR
jgi:hypothetical protein